MRLLISIAVVIMGAFALVACNSTDNTASQKPASNSNVVAQATPAAKPPSDGVRRITTAELQALMNKGQAVVVDVRGEPAYKAGHIKGAKLMPTNEFLSRINELPRDKMIVTYCA